VEFFNKIQLFKKFSNRTIATLIYHFKLEKFRINDLLYSEGDEPDKIYIVESGEVV
jgi:CRP-like cAMP-binding protein